VLDIVIRQLRRAKFERVTIATGYLAELIEAFFRDGRVYDVPIDYFREREPLGTVGALALVEDLDEPFLVMNGDVLTDMDYTALFEHHVASGAAVTVAATRRHVNISLGVMEFGNPATPERLTHYIEKPTLSYEVSMGVYCFAPRVLDHIEPNVRLDFPDLILRLLALGERVNAWRPDVYWLDLGRHDDYEQAMQDFESVRHRLLPGEDQP
jgi:NDP-mannose synthase